MSSSNCWPLLRTSIGLSRQGLHAEAQQLAERVLGQSPSDPRILYQVSLILLEAEAAEQALEVIERSVSLAGQESSVARLYRALILAQLQRWDEALRQAELLQQGCPGNQFLPSLFTYLLLGQGQVERAIEPLQLARPLGWFNWFRPQLANFPPLASRLLFQLESYLLPLEIEQLQATPARTEPQALSLPPQRYTLPALVKSLGSVFLWQYRGAKYLQRGVGVSDSEKRQRYFRRALACQRRAVALGPREFRNHFSLGEALLCCSDDKAQLQEAEACFLHSWSQEGHNPQLFFYLGRTALMLGQPLAAQGYLERAVEKFTKFPEAHYTLGQVSLLMRQPREARGWFCQSVNSDATPVVRDRLVDLLGAVQNGLRQRPELPAWQPSEAELSPEGVVIGESAVFAEGEVQQLPLG